MDTLENPLQLIKLLKGAALSILVILLYEKKPVGAQYLQRWSGYGDKPINQALEFLSDPTVNLVTRVNRYLWQLTALAWQLPLMQTPDSGSWNFSDSRATTATTLNSRECGLSAEAVESSRNFSDSHELSSRIFSESLELLYAASIGEPTASMLAKLNWITPDYIRAHLENARRKDIPSGLLIHKMRSHDPAPENDDPDDYRRYISGPLGNLVQH